LNVGLRRPLIIAADALQVSRTRQREPLVPPICPTAIVDEDHTWSHLLHRSRQPSASLVLHLKLLCQHPLLNRHRLVPRSIVLLEHCHFVRVYMVPVVIDLLVKLVFDLDLVPINVAHISCCPLVRFVLQVVASNPLVHTKRMRVRFA